MGFFSVITWCVWDGGLHMSKGIIRYSKMSGYPCLSKKRSYSLITSNNNRFLRSLLSYSLFLKKNRVSVVPYCLSVTLSHCLKLHYTTTKGRPFCSGTLG